jgi:hypothetical protein
MSEVFLGEQEALFRNICKERPTENSLAGFTQLKDRPEVVAFLVTKLEEYAQRLRDDGPWEDQLEWGAIWATRLLGDFRAELAIAPMIDILGIMIEDYMAFIFSDTIHALQKMGPPAFEPVYQKYLEDPDHPEHHDIWIDIMVNLGVRDQRIKDAILKLVLHNPDPAAHAIADYGDSELLPILENIVYGAAEALNRQRIDPFGFLVRLRSSDAETYFQTRGDLIHLRDGFDYSDSRHATAEAVLDRQLLKYADFAAHEARRAGLFFPTLDDLDRDFGPINNLSKAKVGRNEPCPCGSGKKYKKCCGTE